MGCLACPGVGCCLRSTASDFGYPPKLFALRAVAAGGATIVTASWRRASPEVGGSPSSEIAAGRGHYRRRRVGEAAPDGYSC